MNKKFSILFAGFFLLAVVLMGSFIFAASYNLASSTAEAGNNIFMLAFNVSNVTNSVANLTNVTVNITGTAYLNLGNITNITISNGTLVWYNDSFTTSPVVIQLPFTGVVSEQNYTLNYTLNSTHAKYGVTFGVNVTNLGNQTGPLSNLTYSSLPYNSSLVTITETTNPVPTATCVDFYRAQDFGCTCTGTDSLATDSGVSTSVGTSTAGSITDTSVPGGYTYTCAVTDVAGNTASSTATYQVKSHGVQSGGSGGSAGSVVDPTQKKITLVKMTPGVATIIKNFDKDLGVKEISIEVKTEAKDVKVTVTKYDGKPAAVSKERSGKVYQYFEVSVPGLEGNVAKATMRTKVMKSWVSGEGLEKEEVLVFKFNEGSENWDKLATTYVEDDGTYYYYDVELDSFSYFAISSKTLTEETAEVAKDTAKTIADKTKSNWKWGAVLVILAGLAVWYFFFRKKE